MPTRSISHPTSPFQATVRLGPSPADVPRDRDDPVRKPAETRRRLLADVAGALRANLARGFLESEERIREIAESLSDVVLLSDELSGRVLFVNAAYEPVWGRPRADLYANPFALLEGVHRDDRERVRESLVGAGGRDFDLEFRVVRVTGDERSLWMRGFAVRGADGATHRTASITTDVTDRKRIAESHQRLVRGFTHDVKNPLGAADGYLSLLLDGVFGEMSASQAESIERARRSIHTALHLVSGLLEIERAEGGELSVGRERVDLGSVADEIAVEFRAAAAAKRLDIAVSIRQDDETADAPVVESDGARVRQVLANLVSNAVKYTPPTGRVSIAARVAVAGEAPWRGRWAAITVADSGAGIALEKQALVFREFARFDPGAAAGSGIGLAISRRVARALGGEITFTSSPGVGSAFTLWLPRDPAPTLAESGPVMREGERA